MHHLILFIQIYNQCIILFYCIITLVFSSRGEARRYTTTPRNSKKRCDTITCYANFTFFKFCKNKYYFFFKFSPGPN